MKYKTIISFLLLSVVFSSAAYAQKEWTPWKEHPTEPSLSYRISFAKADEVENKAGYYVEIRNESANRAWFTFMLSPEADENSVKSLTTLKPGTKSVIGIFWTKAVIGTSPSGQFFNVRFEPVTTEQNPVKLTEAASSSR